MKEAHKRNRSHKHKKKYRVTNWAEYDRSLRNRGDITIWFSDEAIREWAPKHKGKRGRPQKFPTSPASRGFRRYSSRCALSVRQPSN